MIKITAKFLNRALVGSILGLTPFQPAGYIDDPLSKATISAPPLAEPVRQISAAFNVFKRALAEDEKSIRFNLGLSNQTINITFRDINGFMYHDFEKMCHDTQNNCAEIARIKKAVIDEISKFPRGVLQMLASNMKSIQFNIQFKTLADYNKNHPNEQKSFDKSVSNDYDLYNEGVLPYNVMHASMIAGYYNVKERAAFISLSYKNPITNVEYFYSTEAILNTLAQTVMRHLFDLNILDSTSTNSHTEGSSRFGTAIFSTHENDLKKLFENFPDTLLREYNIAKQKGDLQNFSIYFPTGYSIQELNVDSPRSTVEASKDVIAILGAELLLGIADSPLQKAFPESTALVNQFLKNYDRSYPYGEYFLIKAGKDLTLLLPPGQQNTTVKVIQTTRNPSTIDNTPKDTTLHAVSVSEAATASAAPAP